MAFSRITTVVYLLIVLQTTAVVAMSLSMYKQCLFECLHCVDTWGKDLFNGEECAENCALSAGESIDRTCTSYFTRSIRRAGRNRQTDTYSASSGEQDYSSYGYGIRGGHPSLRGYGYGFQTSSLSSECQSLCRTCESQFTSSMDAHSCMYTCITTNRHVIRC